MRKFRGKKAEAHYERNAREGRTGRMHIDLDMCHIAEVDRERLGLPGVQIAISDMTMTPEDVAIIMDVLRKYTTKSKLAKEAAEPGARVKEPRRCRKTNSSASGVWV